MWSTLNIIPGAPGDPTDPPGGPVVFTGIGVSQGSVTGPLYIESTDEWHMADRFVRASEAEAEHRRLLDAIEATRATLEDLRSRLLSQGGEADEGQFVFQSHAALLDDPAFRDRVEREILDGHRSADSAVFRFTTSMRAAFLEVENPLFREKALDVQDVMRHLLHHLESAKGGTTGAARFDFEEPHIIVSSDFTPSDVLLFPRDRILAFATEGGSRLSHVSILAKALQIPAVVSLGSAVKELRHGDEAVLDGTRGTLTVRPTPKQIAAARQQRVRLEELDKQFSSLIDQPAVTQDGTRIQLHVNVELPEEVSTCRQYGGDGIGLYRTEYGYLSRDGLPSEEDMFADYHMALTALAPIDVVMRTIDLGGQKVFPLLRHQHDIEDVEHLRGIRLCLRYPEIWMPQLRALWRAATVGNARVLFPLIPGVAEFRAARALALQARDDLVREGIPCAESLPMGAMIELPSAVLVADLLAQEVDFFSIGTNDLIPYSLGLDRAYMDTSMVSEPYHPGVLRSIRRIVDEARPKNLRVTVCGEIASDPVYVLTLIGMGIRELSMSPSAIPEVKRIVRHATLREAEQLAAKVLTLPTAQAVDRELHDYMSEHYSHLLAAHVVDEDGEQASP